jgi:hypothetical protein
VTLDVPVRLVPVIVVVVFPAIGPEVTESEVIVGAATYVNTSALEVAEVPVPFVTVTSTAPALPAGDETVILVGLATTTDVPAVDPNLTPVTPWKLVPVIVTEVPAVSGPFDGEIPVIVGVPAATAAVAVDV